MKFLADMGVSISTVRFLRESGHDVVHLHDIAMQKASDLDIVDYAIREDRFVLTFDLDFGTILASSKNVSPSTLIFRLSDLRPVNVNNLLSKILPLVEKPLCTGSIIIIEQDRIRIRKLPIV